MDFENFSDSGGGAGELWGYVWLKDRYTAVKVVAVIGRRVLRLNSCCGGSAPLDANGLSTAFCLGAPLKLAVCREPPICVLTLHVQCGVKSTL